MKKLLQSLLLLLICSLSWGTFAQNIYSNYQDGKIWFQLNTNTFLNEADLHKDVSDKYYLQSYGFLKKLDQEFQIEKVVRPFNRAKGEGSELLKRTFLVTFSDHQKVDQIIRKISESGQVEYAEKVPLDHTSYTPNDPQFGSMWSLNAINAEQAWNSAVGNASVVVATVDNAIESNHPDLTNMIWTNAGEIPGNGTDDDGNGYIDDVNGWDVADDDNNTAPQNSNWSHGTHVAGSTGAETDNGTGVSSIGFGVSIMPVKATSNSSSYNSVTDGYDGIYYAALNDADVINCSWGGGGSSTTAQNLINWAWNQGSIVVAAAGNDNLNMDIGGNGQYPANYNNVVCVAASNSSDSKSGFSNYGSDVDVTAPGSSIRSTVPFGNYGISSGTSMASPITSGLLGLMISAVPNLPIQEYVNCLISSCDNIDPQNPSYIGDLGGGRINAEEAINCIMALSSVPPIAEFSANITNIAAGGSVVFTDLSSYNPTSWAWNFDNTGNGGVTPTTANTQGQHIVTFNNPGNYEVTLTVTNAFGSDTETKTAYIVVSSAAGCSQINLDDPTFSSATSIHSGWNPVNYSAGAGNGAVAGANIYDDLAKAEYFPAAMIPSGQYVVGSYIWIADAYTATPGATIDLNVYDATGGTPGAIIETRTIEMSDIAGGGIFYFQFDNPAAIPASDEIAVGLDFSSLSWAGGDSLSIVTNTDGEPSNSIGMEQITNGNWQDYPSGWNGLTALSHYIFPEITSDLATVNLSATPTSICEGESVNFDATGSTYDDTLLWSFPGTTPNNSNSVTETIIYNSAGNYTAYLEVIGGGCSNYKVDSVNITVNPTPNISINASSDEICVGDGPVTLTASGANTYAWTPGGQTSAMISVNPASTTTYSVTGTSAGCSDNTNIQITVGDYPVLNANVTDVTCNGDNDGAIDLTVTASSGGETFDWDNDGTGDNDDTEDLSGISAGSYVVNVISQEGCATNATYTVNEPTAIAVNSSTTNAGCGVSDGTATLNISGGTPGYTEDWGAANPNALPAGVHNYTVTDNNGCIFNGSVTINNPPGSPNVTLSSSTDVSCNGDSDGSATINVTGGQAPYSENWGAQNPNNLPAGNHSVTVTDDNNCTGSLVVTINEPAPLTTNPTVTNPDCNGDSNGSVTLNVSGGTPNYTEDWGSEDPNALSAGSYNVIITDANNCSINESVTLTEPSPIDITTSVIDVSCHGDSDGSATLTITGGTPGYTEDWGSENPNALSAGSYNVDVTDNNGCTTSENVIVNEPNAIGVTGTVTPESQVGSSDGAIDISVTGGTPPFTYSWDNGETTEDISGLTSGTYEVTVTDANGCTETMTFDVDNTSSITDWTAKGIKVYPNPATESITIELEGDFKYEIHNGLGQIIYRSDNNLGQAVYNISSLADGIYIVKVLQNNENKTLRLVKK